LGELKGGIDPAGADEHWKTARTALQRIDDAFRKISKRPYTFLALLGLVGKMYSKIQSCWRGGGTNHKDTEDTKIDHNVS
jgi:hypothetical protein